MQLLESPLDRRLSNNNNASNNKNLNIWILFGRVKGKKVKCVCGGQREGASLVSSPPSAPKQDPEASWGRVAPPSGQGVSGWRAGTAGRPLKAGGEGRVGGACEDPLPREETGDCNLPSVCGSFERRGGAGEVPAEARCPGATGQSATGLGGQARRLGGLEEVRARDSAEENEVYEAPAPGGRAAPAGRQHRGRGRSRGAAPT